MQAIRSRSLSPFKLLAAPLVLIAMLLALAAPALASGDDGAGRGDDRIAFTGPVDVPAGQTVEDVVAFDGPVSVAGTVDGDLVAMNGPVQLSGSVDGDVVGLSDAITLSPTASVAGDLVYGEGRPVVPAGATVSGDIHRADAGDFFGRSGDDSFFDFGLWAWLAGWLAVSISSLLLGLALLRLAPTSAARALEIARERTGASVGLGLAVLIGIPVTAITLMITIIGIPLGIALLLALVPLYAIGYVTSAWVLGRRVTGSQRKDLVAFLAGWGILRAIALVPFLGGLVGFAATVFGLGLVALLVQRARGSASPPEATTTPLPA